ncbi:SDR family NAD(P)-dependent oxidoreductase [Tamaricihabitans halophyticus]|uniref:SDR family NAD(P)-dependent oxidoreductase n=1 Tax=Tamaricihabitans halophyticus TaxID=1262583 RepID=UPI001A9D6811|nr:SDR family NAD(P)-dependent oxidoreductase [Tamaricihabitans halophyticus]
MTGAARGIGRAAVELLASNGAKVVISDLDQDAATEASAQISGDTAVHSGNLCDEGAPEALVATAIEQYGQLDIVVNNAGYITDGPLHKLSDQSFQDMLDIHTIVPFRVLRAAAPYLRDPAKRERAEGIEVFRKVVNVTSMAAYGNAGQANYSAAKSGLIGLTKTLAKEWGSFKVNVNAVAFGLVDTRLTQAKTDETVVTIGDKTVHVGVPEQLRSAMNSLVPLGRGATPAEAAGGIGFLCSPWSDHVTGQVLNVGGGLALGMTA